jgi:hypothetical protein
MNVRLLELSRPMIQALESIGSVPVAAEDIGAKPSALVRLANRGLLEADRAPNQPNIYRLTPKGAALIELLSAPITISPCDGPIRRIQAAVARHFGIQLPEMWSARRSREVARPRQVAMYLARELTPMSLPCIGNRFGKRDHTTVMHAIKTVERLVATDPEFAADVAVLREELGDLARQEAAE